MWKCKHCNQEFDFKSTSEKANHSRWCDKNPKRNNTENLKKAQKKINDNKLGEIKTYTVQCTTCQTNFEVEEREKQFPTKENYYCSKSCANSVGGKANSKKLLEDNKLSYRVIAEKHHEKKCLVCGFDKIVEVHHVDEDHFNNKPENLVWLCPNHHQMYHTIEYKDEIKPYIKKYIMGL